LSIRKPKSCRNFASAEAASSFLEAQKQSSVLKGKARTQIISATWQPAGHHRCPPRSSACAQCGPPQLAPTPSEVEAP
ncbi:hypothetical protein XENOCAPTIV_018578, partial [Xenoophorus captivus]